MQSKQIAETVLECLKIFARTKDAPLDENTLLFAAGGLLDSVSLVAFLLELEQRLSEQYSHQVRLISDKALSEKNSPFRTVSALVEFIQENKE